MPVLIHQSPGLTGENILSIIPNCMRKDSVNFKMAESLLGLLAKIKYKKVIEHLLSSPHLTFPINFSMALYSPCLPLDLQLLIIKIKG